MRIRLDLDIDDRDLRVLGYVPEELGVTWTMDHLTAALYVILGDAVREARKESEHDTQSAHVPLPKVR